MMTEEELLNELRSVAADQRDGLAIYALLDSAIYAGATMDESGKRYGNLALVLADAKPESLFVYAFDDERTDASPLLVSIRDLDGELAKRIATLALEYHLASWIWSPLPAQALARHLAAFIRAKFRASAAMLRPYDPRVMEDTIACLDPGRQAALWEPVFAWAYFDEGGAVKQLQRPEVRPTSRVAVPLVLDDEEQGRLEGLASRIALQTYIETHAPSVMEPLSLAQRKAFCVQQIGIGERLRVQSMGDLLIVAALSGAYGGQWIDEEAIQPLARSVFDGTVSLALVATEITDRLGHN